MKYINYIIVDAKLMIKQVILNLKFVAKNKINLFLFLSFTFFALCIPVIFMPSNMVFNLMIQIATIIPLGLLYASISYEWRRSTLYNNLLKTRNNKILYNLSIITTMTIFCIILTIIILVSFLILNTFSLVLTGWWEYGGRDVFSILGNNFQWSILVYTQFINILLMFFIGFFLQSFIKNQNGFYVSIMSLTIFIIIFGGGMNDFFDSTATTINGKNVPIFFPAAMPTSLYWLSIFVPFYPTGQQLQFASDHGTRVDGGVNNWVWLTWNMFIDKSWIIAGSPKWVGLWAWNILWVIPWVQIISLGMISMFIRKVIK